MLLDDWLGVGVTSALGGLIEQVSALTESEAILTREMAPVIAARVTDDSLYYLSSVEVAAAEYAEHCEQRGHGTSEKLEHGFFCFLARHAAERLLRAHGLDLFDRDFAVVDVTELEFTDSRESFHVNWRTVLHPKDWRWTELLNGRGHLTADGFYVYTPPV
jgi:hypothetical protein